MADTKNLVEFLKKKKIKKETIEKIIDSGLPYEQLRRNPFRTWYGIDPFSAEKIAENIEPYDSHRLAGFIYISFIIYCINCKIPIHLFYGIVNKDHWYITVRIHRLSGKVIESLFYIFKSHTCIT